MIHRTKSWKSWAGKERRRGAPSSKAERKPSDSRKKPRNLEAERQKPRLSAARNFLGRGGVCWGSWKRCGKLAKWGEFWANSFPPSCSVGQQLV